MDEYKESPMSKVILANLPAFFVPGYTLGRVKRDTGYQSLPGLFLNDLAKMELRNIPKDSPDAGQITKKYNFHERSYSIILEVVKVSAWSAPILKALNLI